MHCTALSVRAIRANTPLRQRATYTRDVRCWLELMLFLLLLFFFCFFLLLLLFLVLKLLAPDVSSSAVTTITTTTAAVDPYCYHRPYNRTITTPNKGRKLWLGWMTCLPSYPPIYPSHPFPLYLPLNPPLPPPLPPYLSLHLPGASISWPEGREVNASTKSLE